MTQETAEEGICAAVGFEVWNERLSSDGESEVDDCDEVIWMNRMILIEWSSEAGRGEAIDIEKQRLVICSNEDPYSRATVTITLQICSLSSWFTSYLAQITSSQSLSR